MRVWLISLWIVAGLAGCAKGKPAVWEWSEDNGDKPGIGLALGVSGDATTGTFYLLDPQKPHDLSSAGQIVRLTDLQRHGRTLTFTVTLASDGGQHKESLVLELDGDLAGAVGANVIGTLRSAEASSPPTQVVFV